MEVHKNYIIAYRILVLTIGLDLLKNILTQSFSEIGDFVFIFWLLLGLFILARIVKRGKKWPAFIFIALILLEASTVGYQILNSDTSTISLISTFILVPLEATAVYFILTAPKAVKMKKDDSTILDYNV